MLTFHQFLIEKFLRGGKGNYGYTEIYVNPTRSELREVGHHWISADNVYDLGGLIMPKKLYVWDREICTHDTMLTLLDRLVDDTVVPIYLTYFPETKTAKIALAMWSASDSIAHKFGAAGSRTGLINYAKKHPAFRIFDKVVLA
jgi:hypothetical protein